MAKDVIISKSKLIKISNAIRNRRNRTDTLSLDKMKSEVDFLEKLSYPLDVTLFPNDTNKFILDSINNRLYCNNMTVGQTADKWARARINLKFGHSGTAYICGNLSVDTDIFSIGKLDVELNIGNYYKEDKCTAILTGSHQSNIHFKEEISISDSNNHFVDIFFYQNAYSGTLDPITNAFVGDPNDRQLAGDPDVKRNVAITNIDFIPIPAAGSPEQKPLGNPTIVKLTKDKLTNLGNSTRKYLSSTSNYTVDEMTERIKNANGAYKKYILPTPRLYKSSLHGNMWRTRVYWDIINYLPYHGTGIPSGTGSSEIEYKLGIEKLSDHTKSYINLKPSTATGIDNYIKNGLMMKDLTTEIANKGNIKVTVQAISHSNYYNNSAISEALELNLIPQIATPVITITGTKVSWNIPNPGINELVPILQIDNITKNLPGKTSYDLKANGYTFGSYSVKVMFESKSTDYIDSSWCTAQTVYIPTALAVPTNVRMDGETIRWDAVSHAQNYRVSIEGTLVNLNSYSQTVIGTSLDLHGYGTGVYDIKVRAEAPTDPLYNSSAYSSVIEGVVYEKLAKPVITSTSQGVLSWNAVTAADYYDIEIEGTSTYVTTTSNTSIDLKGKATIGIDTYNVTAFSNKKCYRSSDTATGSIIIPSFLPAPSGLAFDGRSVISWNKVTHASSYRLSIVSNNSSYKTKEYTINDPNTTTFNLISNGHLPNPGYKYTIKIRSNGDGINYLSSDYGTAISVTVPQQLAKPSLSANINLVSWGAVSHAGKYRVKVLDSAGHVEYDDYQTATTYNVSAFGVDHYNVYVTAIATDTTNYYNSETTGIAAKVQTTLAIPTLAYDPDTNMLSWNAISHRVQYKLTIIKGSSTETDTTTATSYSLNNKAVGDYTVKIQTIGDGDLYLSSGISAGKSVVVSAILATPVIATLTTATVTWGAIGGASSYDIYINNSNVANTTSTSYSINSLLTVGYNNKVQIRAIGDGTHYKDSSLSTAKYIILKGTLSTPVTTVSDMTISWGAISHATSYNVKVPGVTTKATTGTSMNIDTETTAAPGHYSVQVQAIGDSTYWNSSSYSTGKDVKIWTTLSAPTGLSISGNVISWNAVSHAVQYELLLNSQYKLHSSSNSLTIPDSYDPGHYSVKAKSIGNDDTYLSSTYSATTSINYYKQISTPSLSVSGSTVSWTGCNGAKRYKVTIEGYGSLYVTGTSINISSYKNPGDWDVSVQAIATSSSSDSSYWLDSGTATKTDVRVTKTLAVPTGLSVSGTTFSWTAVTGASSYDIRYVGDTSHSTSTTSTSVNISGATPDHYKIKVRAIGDGTYWLTGGYSAEKDITVTMTLSAPVNIHLDTNIVRWNAVSHATKYKIKFNNGTEFNASTNSYILSDSYSPGKYTVNVKAIGDSDLYFDSGYSANATILYYKQIATPTLSASGSTMSWTSVTGVTNYYLELTNGNTIDTGMSTSVNLHDHYNSVGSHTYTGKVYAENVNNSYWKPSEYSNSKSVTYTQMAAPAGLSISGSTISWNAITGASNYQLGLTGPQTFNNTVSGTSKSISGWTPGRYTGKVKANGNNTTYYTSAWSANATLDYYRQLSTPATTVSGTTISWGSVANAASYLVKIPGIGNKSTTSTSMNIASYAGAGHYNVQVQAVGSGYWTSSSWSTAKDVKITMTLAVPTNIHLSTSNIVWNTVSNASSYNVVINSGSAKNVSTNFIPVPNSVPGNYKVKVQAVGDSDIYLTSSYSSIVSLDYYRPLDRPYISANHAVISWDAIPNASTYQVSLDDANELITVSTNSVDIYEESTYNIYHTAGVHNVSVKVRANANGYWTASSKSNEVDATYTVLNKPTNIRYSTSDNKIHWNSVSGADIYAVYVDGEFYDTASNTSIGTGPIGGGTYTIGVKADSSSAGYYASEMAISQITIATQLSEPALIGVDDGLLEFSAPRCEYVRCQINGITNTSFHTTVNISWDLNEYDLKPKIKAAGGTSGMYECNLQAIGNGTTTLDSTSTTYTQFYATISQPKWVKLRCEVVSMDMADIIFNIYIDSCSSNTNLSDYTFDVDGEPDYIVEPPRGQKQNKNGAKEIYCMTPPGGELGGMVMVWYNNNYADAVYFSLVGNEGNSAVLNFGNDSVSTWEGSGTMYAKITFN